MSKAVHWTIPFQSVKGIDYEIRIYDDYTGSVPAAWPVTLQAGDTPITTQEDASDDFFTPVRPSTGTISVIDPDGTLMEQLIPANNIARPVRLISIDRTTTPATETIEWQGFLSCEAYQQDYTAIAQELQLSIISVLEAMDSVEFDITFGGMRKVRTIIKEAIDTLEQATGMTGTFTNILFSATGWKIMNKYINVNTLFDVREQSNQGNTTYVLYGLSCKEVIRRICTFMGWCTREQGQKLYLQQIVAEWAMLSVPYATMSEDNDTTFYNATTRITMSEPLMSDLTYRGTGHTKSISQGAKSVEVVSKLEDYDVEVDVPQQLPPENIQTANRTFTAGDKTVNIYASMNTSFDNHYTFRRFFMDEGQGETPWIREIGTNLQVFNNSWVGNRKEQSLNFNDYVGGLMCQVKDANDEYDQSGLLVTAIYTDAYETEFLTDPTKYILKCRSIRHLSASAGSIKIKLDYKLISRSAQILDYDGIGDWIKVIIRWGNRSLVNENGTYSWGVGTNIVTLDNTNEEITVPITTYNTGELEMFILPAQIRRFTTNIQYEDYAEYIIKSLNVSYEPKSIIGEDRSENHYFKLLGVNFNDEVRINCDYASNMHNVTSPSHIFDDNETPITTLEYTDGFTVETPVNYSQRPEIQLLNRLAAFYCKPRRTIELETEHPTTSPIPLLYLCYLQYYETGSKMYLIMSESRDWQTDTSKLFCIQTIDYGE